MSTVPLFRPLATALSLASIAVLAACGGGGSDASVAAPPVAEAPAPVVATTLGGTVAVGAPISDGKLRILDADGGVVASDIAIGADGSYAGIALSGPAPYRIEACGNAGPNYLCVYSTASAAGTANVTPLTTATVLLATGQSPNVLMSGAAPALTADAVAAAQAQLRNALANVLASANVASGFDFIAGALEAGSRSGYDGVLDAVGVELGVDDHPFVQITPRLGSGNLYLEQGSSSGSVTSTTSAASLQMSGLESLFRDMSAALAGPAACSAASTGIQRSLATTAQLSMGGGQAAHGASDVAAALCGFFAQGDDGNTPLWGSTLLSPTLGRCDLSAGAPVCKVDFVLRGPDGAVQPVGSGMGVTVEAGAWKFVGDLIPIEIHASAKAQRTVRGDSAGAPIDYNRALTFEVAALPGLACAQVAQRDAGGTLTTVGYYKRHPGATDQQRLSLWSANSMSWGASLDPLVGATRSADDSWIVLPEGSAGDAVVRNFYRGGRSVLVSLFADAACSQPFTVAGKSEFEVEVDGVPPVWSAMPNLPWPEVDASSIAALDALQLDAGATGSLHVGWSFPRGPLGLNGITVCGSRAECGQGGSGRVGERSLRPNAHDADVALANHGGAIAPTDSKTLALYGRNGEGVDLQSNLTTCPATPIGERCQ